MIVLSSCAINYPVPNRLRKELNCYTGEYTGLDTLINIHGYYTQKIVLDHRGLYKKINGEFKEIGFDTTYYNFIFFDDGIFIGDIGSHNMTVKEYLTKMAEDTATFDLRAFYQGTYQIFGDTIKVQYVSYGNANVWFAKEEWYKIIDKNTIVNFYKENVGLAWEDRNKKAYQPKWYNNAYPSKFVYVEIIPESSSWLKGQKWFYCLEKKAHSPM